MKGTNDRDTITLNKSQLLELSDAFKDLAIGLNELQASIELLNILFIRQVFNCAVDNLKVDIDPVEYSDRVLNKLWNGETYQDTKGRVRYHEIKSKHTKDNMPVYIVGD